MVKKNLGVGRGVWWRNLLIAACAGVATLWTSAANATITQGDFSVFGFFETRESGRWGEGGAKDGSGRAATFTAPVKIVPGVLTASIVTNPGRAPTESGGSFEFNRWDLVQARQLADVRPDYHIVKNYKLLGRFDTLILKDADFFAFYRPWYDAFGSLKRRGRAETSRDIHKWKQQNLQELFFRNDLREYYAQLNFTDNFSARIGKQQVIWSEADALSGTEITNPADLRYHWTHFETPENLRKNVRMLKFNYILPDFLKTANNELEAFVIPGDYQGDTAVVTLADSRSPWVADAALGKAVGYNFQGQPYRISTFGDAGPTGLAVIGLGQASPLNPHGAGGPPNVYVQQHVFSVSNNPRNSLDRSEFGVRYSTLLPIGNCLQASFIYLYEARYSKTGFCSSCPTPKNPNLNLTIPALGLSGGVIKAFPGVFLLPGHFDFGTPPPGGPLPLGTLRVEVSSNYRRNHFFGLTGTYYDKDLTDMVFRYDVLYAPKVGDNLGAIVPFGHSGNGHSPQEVNGIPTRNARLGTSAAKWTEEARFILAGDRPTYIPWISKQHTFLTAQYINTWYPDLPGHSTSNILNSFGKIRREDNLAFVAAVNWLINGQLTTTNVFAWDVDDNVGFASSSNVYRYSRNILLGLNTIWYLGRSGRNTDPFIFSRDQRINELEATLSYEI